MAYRPVHRPIYLHTTTIRILMGERGGRQQAKDAGGNGSGGCGFGGADGGDDEDRARDRVRVLDLEQGRPETS